MLKMATQLHSNIDKAIVYQNSLNDPLLSLLCYKTALNFCDFENRNIRMLDAFHNLHVTLRGQWVPALSVGTCSLRDAAICSTFLC